MKKLLPFFLMVICSVLFLMNCSTLKDVDKKIIPESKIKPPRLNKGDTVGLVSPASYITKDQLDEAIKNLEDLGFKVKYSDIIMQKYGYLAGTDSARAKDLNDMFADKDVNGIFAIRGGYGCSRMLDFINYNLVKANPKVLIGYSDITSLLYGIYSQTDLVCFHGPVGTSTFNDYSINNFENIIVNPHNNFEQKNLPEDENQIYVIKSGIGKGELVGGNLSIVVSMIGTKYDIDTKGKIIFLEDVGEEPYRIDRMLTQMKLAGKFDNCNGVALGVFRKCDIKKNDPEFENSLTLKQIFNDIFGNLNVPVIYGLSFGHIENKFTLPFGVKAKLDTYKRTLTLLEKAVE